MMAVGSRRGGRSVVSEVVRWSLIGLFTLAATACGDIVPSPDVEGRDVASAIAPAAGPRAGAALRDAGVVYAQDQAVAAALLARAARGERVRVIAELELAFQPEPRLDAATAATQRSEIALAASALLQRLAPLAPGAVRTYRTLPFVALTIDEAGLLALLADPAVRRVVEDEPMRLQLAESVPLVEADTVWSLGYDGSGVAVAVLDTGVDSAHAFLGGRVVAEACFSSSFVMGPYTSTTVCPSGTDPGGADEQIGPGAGVHCAVDGCAHGTHVAGIVAGSGVVPGPGVAPGSSIVAVQVFSVVTGAECGVVGCLTAWTSDLVRALEFASELQGGAVPGYEGLAGTLAAVNMSLGGGAFASTCDANPTKPAIDGLRSLGVASVVASGNDGNTAAISAPACVSTAVAVGSTGDGSGGAALDVVSAFTNSSDELDLLAPGQWITSSVPGGSVATFQGTSMATPHVAGAWALLKQARPGLSVADALEALVATGVTVADTRFGAGGRQRPRIDVAAAMAHAPSGRSVIWDQPMDGDLGISSSYSLTADAGAYAAADFVLSAPVDLAYIAAEGFGTPLPPIELEQLRWYLYPDAAGVPAGHPEDGLEQHLWSLTIAPDADGVSVVEHDLGVRLELDLEVATGSALRLDPGSYWLVVAPAFTGGGGDPLDEMVWFWHQSALQQELAQFVSPDVYSVSDWEPVDTDLPAFEDVAFRLEGTVIAGDLALSTLSVEPTAIPADGAATATVTVELRGAGGLPIGESLGTVGVATTAGSLGPVTDHGDGSYTATLTSATTPGVAVVSATLDGAPLVATANVTFTAAAALAVEAGAADDRVVDAGSTGVVLAHLTASVPAFAPDTTIETLEVAVADLRAPGASPVDTGGLSAIRVYLDPTGLGQIGPGSTLLGSGAAFSAAGVTSVALDPAPVASEGAPVTLVVTADVADSSAALAPSAPIAALLLALPAALMLGRGRRHRRWSWLAIALVVTLAACGGELGGGLRAYDYATEVRSAGATAAGAPVPVSGLPAAGARVRFEVP
jgi:subtilisin